jgi:carbon monoxide dehydrogenase subunit G
VEQSGEYRVPASRETVWEALNDPQVLSRCLDGCQSMEKTADDRFDAKVKAKVGPVRATFDAALQLEDVQPPERYTINANVKGGPAGFAKGTAHVSLTDDGDGTVLSYTVHANVGGKLAQVGNRLIDGAARKMAEDFFAALRRDLGGADATDGDDVDAGQSRATGAPGPSKSAGPKEARAYESGGKWMIWLAAFVALFLALLFAF